MPMNSLNLGLIEETFLNARFWERKLTAEAKILCGNQQGNEKFLRAVLELLMIELHISYDFQSFLGI